MLIRVGYEMVFDIPTPVPMLLMLGLRPNGLRRCGAGRAEGRAGGPGRDVHGWLR